LDAELLAIVVMGVGIVLLTEGVDGIPVLVALFSPGTAVVDDLLLSVTVVVTELAVPVVDELMADLLAVKVEVVDLVVDGLKLPVAAVVDDPLLLDADVIEPLLALVVTLLSGAGALVTDATPVVACIVAV